MSESSQQSLSGQALLNAWILPLAEGMTVALGTGELKYLEQVTEPTVAPGLPACCEQGFVWRGQLVPIVNLPQLITRQRIPLADEQLVAIVAYEDRVKQELQLGALALHQVPGIEEIDLRHAQTTDQLPTHWRPLAHAAFEYRNVICPVLDLTRLFTATPSEFLALHDSNG